MLPFHMKAHIATASLASVLALGSSAHAFGPSWEEDLINDAKGLANTAQLISTGSAVTTITGTLGNYPLFGGEADVVDMYLIRLSNPGVLKISTAGGALGGSSTFDSQLFLFRADGVIGDLKALALLANNDAGDDTAGGFIGPAANDGSGFVVSSPGLYFIAITAFGTNPFTSAGDSIWGPLGSGQIAFGQNRELVGWATPGQAQGGSYTIRVDGFEGVPSPGAVALFALAGLNRRRRR